MQLWRLLLLLYYVVAIGIGEIVKTSAVVIIRAIVVVADVGTIQIWT